MSKITTFMTKSNQINAKSFYPRKYDPIYLKIETILKKCQSLENYISEDIKSGSTPPAEMFLNKSDNANYFIKTSAIERHVININDLYNINKEYHKVKLKRSITKPYEIIYSMTGKYMGKAAMCPNTISEINMSQNSVRITTNNKKLNAFIEIFLNSNINRTQVKGLYSITKQKYINQNKIALLKVPEYTENYDNMIDKYLTAFDNYYKALDDIKCVINEFDNLVFNEEKVSKSFKINAKSLTKKMFTPTYYSGIMSEEKCIDYQYFDLNSKLENKNYYTGKDIGSSNYVDEGIPFIKTSDIVNFDVDYHPDCYCNEKIYKQVIQKGDLVFTKDGKIGEVAIIGQDFKVMLSGGIVILKPKNDDERFGMFLLLSSKYGKLIFDKWSVIASTMMHLRKESFLDNLKNLDYHNLIVGKFINKLKTCFEIRDISFKEMEKISEQICEEILKSI